MKFNKVPCVNITILSGISKQKIHLYNCSNNPHQYYRLRFRVSMYIHSQRGSGRHLSIHQVSVLLSLSGTYSSASQYQYHSFLSCCQRSVENVSMYMVVHSQNIEKLGVYRFYCICETRTLLFFQEHESRHTVYHQLSLITKDSAFAIK